MGCVELGDRHLRCMKVRHTPYLKLEYLGTYYIELRISDPGYPRSDSAVPNAYNHRGVWLSAPPLGP